MVQGNGAHANPEKAWWGIQLKSAKGSRWIAEGEHCDAEPGFPLNPSNYYQAFSFPVFPFEDESLAIKFVEEVNCLEGEEMFVVKCIPDTGTHFSR